MDLSEFADNPYGERPATNEEIRDIETLINLIYNYISKYDDQYFKEILEELHDDGLLEEGEMIVSDIKMEQYRNLIDFLREQLDNHSFGLRNYFGQTTTSVTPTTATIAPTTVAPTTLAPTTLAPVTQPVVTQPAPVVTQPVPVTQSVPVVTQPIPTVTAGQTVVGAPPDYNTIAAAAETLAQQAATAAALGQGSFGFSNYDSDSDLSV